MRTIISVTTLSLLSLTGCGPRSQEEAMEKALKDKADVSITDDGISIQGKDGKFSMTAGKDAKVPAGFPADVLVYSGAEVLMAMEIENGHSLQLKTSDDVDKVAEAYLGALGSKQWKKESDTSAGNQKVFGFSKDKRRITLSIAKQPDATYIAMVVIKQPQG